jgi:hypothetical protein
MTSITPKTATLRPRSEDGFDDFGKRISYESTQGGGGKTSSRRTNEIDLPA